jgi:hypothetical protein
VLAGRLHPKEGCYFAVGMGGSDPVRVSRKIERNPLRARVQATGGKASPIKVLRKGKTIELTVTPERRKPDEETVAEADRLTRQYIRLRDGNRGRPTAQNGAAVLRDVPIIDRLFLNNGQSLNLSRPIELGQPAPPDLAKKIDGLTAQVQALTKAVEELRKQKGDGK